MDGEPLAGAAGGEEGEDDDDEDGFGDDDDVEQMMLTRMIVMEMTKQAASETQEPTGGGELGQEGEVGGEGEGEGEKEEKREGAKVENGGIPGPTMVVQSRTIRSLTLSRTGSRQDLLCNALIQAFFHLYQNPPESGSSTN